MSEKQELDGLRRQIDALDNELLELLNLRMEVVRKVGELKRTSNAVIYRPEREKIILDRLERRSSGVLNRQAIEAIFLEIFAVSRNVELPERVAYLGPEGSFTHQAAESRFGAMSEYLPLHTIRGIFETVETGRARFGVVPVENNQEGVVQETLDYLATFDLHIVAEVPMAIHFAFATLSERPKEVKRIYSRDIAFRQCKKFIENLYGKDEVQLIPVDSTSRGVQIALQEPTSAAICSHIAARQHNLPMLFDNIEDSEENQTRFLIISKDFINNKGKEDKTSILASLPDQPGSLAAFLQEFNNQGINLTKIESRPAKKGKNFKYRFFIDFDGHFEDENVRAILARHKKDIKWLGSYVKLC